MKRKIVESRTFVTLLGGGKAQKSHILKALEIAPILVAADGGANSALEFGLSPAAVIGDMDSLTAENRAALPAQTVFEISEQDSTDFEKCLREIDAPAVLALGFTGARLDHTLAACSVISRFPDKAVILIGEEDICFLAPRHLALPLCAGDVVSIFPLSAMRGRSRGLEYPIDGLTLDPLGRVGTSNEALGNIELEISEGEALVMLQHDALPYVLDALTGK